MIIYVIFIVKVDVAIVSLVVTSTCLVLHYCVFNFRSFQVGAKVKTDVLFLKPCLQSLDFGTSSAALSYIRIS